MSGVSLNLLIAYYVVQLSFFAASTYTPRFKGSMPVSRCGAGGGCQITTCYVTTGPSFRNGTKRNEGRTDET